jgi:hypothetical protein
MKLSISVLAAVAVFLAFICVVQSKKLGKQETQVSSLNKEVTEKSQRLEQVQRSNAAPAQPAVAEAAPSDPVPNEPAVQPKQATTHVSPANPNVGQPTVTAESPSNGGAADSKSPGEASAFAKMLSKMMQDPETKKMLREQQRTTIDQLYSPLVKQLAMTPEESDKLKDLLADQTMQGSALLFGNQGSSKAKDLVASATASQLDLDNKVKELLGDDRYAQFKDYQLTVGERMQLNQFKQMTTENPVTDQQAERLLAIIGEEKKNLTGPNGEALAGFSSNSKASLSAMMSDDSMEKLLQAQTEVNDRVYQRANEVLSPDQLAAFGKFQTNQTALMRVGVTMARKMFGSDASGSPEK